MRRPFLVLIAIWVVTACSSSAGRDPLSDPPVVDPGASATATPSDAGLRPTPAASLGLPASIIDPVVAEIAQVAGVPPSEVVVTSAEAVTFPNGGLGCPEPGMMYTQVLVDGYKIVAEAAGTTFDYRGSSRSGFRRCQ